MGVIRQVDSSQGFNGSPSAVDKIIIYDSTTHHVKELLDKPEGKSPHACEFKAKHCCRV